MCLLPSIQRQHLSHPRQALAHGDALEGGVGGASTDYKKAACNTWSFKSWAFSVFLFYTKY